MKPYVSMPFSAEYNTYTLGITTRNATVDQKRNVIELYPGYQTSVSVIPQRVDVEHDFELVSIPKRNCKFPFETDELPLNITKEYTKVGCELECAAEKAAFFCKCLPWHYTNNFTKMPICDTFGGHCFERIMSNEKYYKMCPNVCLQDCKGISMAVVTSHIKINADELCKEGSFMDQLFETSSRQFFPFEHYKILFEGSIPKNVTLENEKRISSLENDTHEKEKRISSLESFVTDIAEILKSNYEIRKLILTQDQLKTLPNIDHIDQPKDSLQPAEETGETNFEDHLKSMNSSNAEWRQSMCKAFVEKYVAIVSVQSPTSTVSHSIRDVRDTFIERLGLLGGTVGLFTGFSLLSMLDWTFFLIKLFKFLKNRRIENDQENKEDNDLDEVKSIQDSDFHKVGVVNWDFTCTAQFSNSLGRV